MATCSSQLFAFARDYGVPYRTFVSRVRPGWHILLNSVAISFVIAIGLCLINIDSIVASNSVASLGTRVLLSSCIIIISCMFVKRWRGEPLLTSELSLDQVGIWTNGIMVLYLCAVFTSAFFPTSPCPTPSLMNWSILIHGVVIMFSPTYFAFEGKRAYDGPVDYLEKDLEGKTARTKWIETLPQQGWDVLRPWLHSSLVLFLFVTLLMHVLALRHSLFDGEHFITLLIHIRSQNPNPGLHC